MTVTASSAGGAPSAASQAGTAVVILGAGRSGTSAITRGLQALGVDLGPRLRRGRGKNPTGFFEDRDLLGLTRRLKRVLGIRGDSVALIEPAAWRTPAVEALSREAVAVIARRFGEVPLWGFKHGRTLRLLPFWEGVFRALELDVRYLLALRNPISVARSRGALDPRRGSQEKSDLEWLVNVVPHARMMAARPFVAVDYDRVMADPRGQLRRIATRLDLPLDPAAEGAIERYASTFLQTGRRHSRFTLDDLEGSATVNPLVRDAYRWLDGLAGDAIAADDATLWRDWARIEAAVAALAPLLRHIDAVEAELRRARRNPAGPLQAVPHLWRQLRRG